MKRVAAQAALAAFIVAGCSAGLARPARFEAPFIGAASCRSEAAAQGAARAVRWLGPAEAGEKARLDSWCAAVGPVLFRDTLAPALPRLDDVMFVSWNVHVGAADIERFVEDLRSGRLSDDRRPRHVVLMLQEAVRSGDVPLPVPRDASAASWIGVAGHDAVEIDAVSQKLNMSVFYAPSMRNGLASDRYSPTDRGNAILSTLPLSDPAAIELPGDGQRRVAVTAAIELAVGGRSVPFSVGAAHLATLGPPRTLWVFGAAGMRRTQARSLAAALPGGPLVLGADLNSWMGGPDEPAARDLLRAFPSTPGGRRQPTFSAGLVLDYMFFRPPAGWRAHLLRAPERYGSDHYPLIGWLERWI